MLIPCCLSSGVDSVNITIQVLPDSIPELDETFTIQLHNVSELNQRLQPGSVSSFKFSVLTSMTGFPFS